MRILFLPVVVAQVAVVPPTSNFVDGTCFENYDATLHAGLDVFPYKFSADYALLWDVEYFGTYKVLTNKLRNETWALFQCKCR